MIDDPLVQADRWLAAGRAADAVALVERIAAAGVPAAMYRLATWQLVGAPLPRDLPGARLWLRRAGDAGDLDAALMEVALTANGTGAPPDWAAARALLQRAAQGSSIAAEQNVLLERMDLTSNGAPAGAVEAVPISATPNVWHVPRLLTADECYHVAASAVDLLTPATVVDPGTGRNVANPVRTSDGAVIGPMRETLVVQALNRRIAAVSGTDMLQGEALAVLRYRLGQQFRPHLDAIAGAGNQRVKTVLIYLNDGFTGGATTFAHSGLSVTPRTGDAIIFDNVRSDGTIDPASQHAGEPVTRGEKWLATRWIRARPFDVWTGPESAP